MSFDLFILLFWGTTFNVTVVDVKKKGKNHIFFHSFVIAISLPKTALASSPFRSSSIFQNLKFLSPSVSDSLFLLCHLSLSLSLLILFLFSLSHRHLLWTKKSGVWCRTYLLSTPVKEWSCGTTDHWRHCFFYPVNTAFICDLCRLALNHLSLFSFGFSALFSPCDSILIINVIKIPSQLTPMTSDLKGEQVLKDTALQKHILMCP